jgi:hypothetical protein
MHSSARRLSGGIWRAQSPDDAVGSCSLRADISPSHSAVDRCKKFRKDFVVKGFQPPKTALRALDNKVLSKHEQPLRSTAFSDREEINVAPSAKVI